MTALHEAAQRRAAAAKEGRAPSGVEFRSQTVPNGVAARRAAFPAQMRVSTVMRDGKAFHEVSGTASAYEQPYDMWDWAGPYKEVVSAAAGAKSLAAKPDVHYLVNHTGLSLARTRAGSLQLWEDERGLGYKALLNPQRDEVRNLVLAMQDGLITENSFAFMIDRGDWSEDFTEFRIQQYDIDRGDVSAVNYGANPYTDPSARSQEIFQALEAMPTGAAREALTRLARRSDMKFRAGVQDAPDAAQIAQALGWFSAIDNIVDEAQEALAAYLGIPNPDADEMDDMSGMDMGNMMTPRGTKAPKLEIELTGRSTSETDAWLAQVLAKQH